ncbi:MAG: hypothetical protein Q9187_003906 [Circinaria calcarea]
MLRTYATFTLLVIQFAVAQVDRSGWTVTADSFQSGNEPAKVFDGAKDSIWHTQSNPTNVPFPHNITIDMKTTHNVNALAYQPRQDGVSNGNIGQHTIELSLDGKSWGAPVAIGSYRDDATVKKTTFVTRPARYVRLTALSEAGGRGPWTSAAEINVFASTSYTAPPTDRGQWGPTIDFPIVPVAAAIEQGTGKLLTWSSFSPDSFGGGPLGVTVTSTYDPATSVVSQRDVTETAHDMFCPGLSIDGTGRIFVTGGNDAGKTSIYSPGSGAWVTGATMKITRGYQSGVTLSDGRTFTIGGSWSGGTGNKNGEIYDPTSNAWSLLPGCPVVPMLTADIEGVYRQDNHAWLFGWKDGFVFQAGPSKAMNWYGTSGGGTRTGAGNRGTDPDSMSGNAVMYDALNGKILTVGGSPNYVNSDATSNAHVITIDRPGATASVAKVSSMTYRRLYANSVVLPDGKVFVTGGQTYGRQFTDDFPVLQPEMWDPVTSGFTTLSPMAIPRTYHSIALLMPDATVINGGGGLCGPGCGVNHFDAEVYSPPYLFTASGARATRPTINSVSPTDVTVGGTITITMNSAVSSFSLVRFGSTTHTVNTDQRRIPLTARASGLTYTVTVPGDPGIALPGYWMLFALNSAGVPSVARTVLIKR